MLINKNKLILKFLYYLKLCVRVSNKDKKKTKKDYLHVINCDTIEIWNKQFQKANESKSLMIINFTASWCGPCRRINPFYRELAKKFPNVIFLEVDVDELMSVAEDWTVEAMPTFLFLKEGNIVDKMVGSREEELHHIIQSNISTSAEPSSSSHII
ncbi:thioredoxin H1 [Cannabis sativa]|uniref:thioredoxin H1 n=1 Tax=Cannabis sativa TaxID=3483 RepID=UPI0029C9FB3C|nr:thioredoxin H1 [Cannabis sativa]